MKINILNHLNVIFLYTTLNSTCIYFTVQWHILHDGKLKQHKEEKVFCQTNSTKLNFGIKCNHS